eukprot:scaffold77586_cov21-Prasinocladus_malaysianus.AAC.2
MTAAVSIRLVLVQVCCDSRRVAARATLVAIDRMATTLIRATYYGTLLNLEHRTRSTKSPFTIMTCDGPLYWPYLSMAT